MTRKDDRKNPSLHGPNRHSSDLQTTSTSSLSAHELDARMKQAHQLARQTQTWEAAKKILGEILRLDSSYVPARKLLEEIQENELKAVLGDTSRARAKGAPLDLGQAVEKQLLSDLGLASPGSDEIKAKAELIRLVQGLTLTLPEDRMNLAVGMLELECFKAAVELLSPVVEEFKEQSEHQALFCASSWLLAEAYLKEGQASACIAVLQLVLGHSDVPQEDKICFLYGMGQAYEHLGKTELALLWYQQVQQSKPHYRNTSEKIGRLSRRGK